MHPAYVDEKHRALELAWAGESVFAISATLGREYPALELYVRDSIACTAVTLRARELERASSVGCAQYRAGYTPLAL